MVIMISEDVIEWVMMEHTRFTIGNCYQSYSENCESYSNWVSCIHHHHRWIALHPDIANYEENGEPKYFALGDVIASWRRLKKLIDKYNALYVNEENRNMIKESEQFLRDLTGTLSFEFGNFDDVYSEDDIEYFSTSEALIGYLRMHCACYHLDKNSDKKGIRVTMRSK